MVEVEKEENKVPRALLVGEPGNDLQELKGLVQTLGLDIVQRLTLNRRNWKSKRNRRACKTNQRRLHHF